MIGRFANLGTYRELFDVAELVRVMAGGLLAVAGFAWEKSVGAPAAVGTSLILLSVALNGVPIIWGALTGLYRKKVNVDELVSMAIIASLIAGEFLSAAVVSFVMVLGAQIEAATGETARRAIKALVKISPREATVLTDQGERRKPVSEIHRGDVLRVKAGEILPVDAVIEEGITTVDESSITGEPIPKQKHVGDTVYAGTVNQTGVINIRSIRVGKDTTLGRVIQLVSEAEAHQPESVALIDRYARWFTPAILMCAAAAWVVTGEISRAVTVLIVGCPCALILAAPTAIIAAISRAAKEGVLIKGGRYIEAVASAKTLLFDKTGTLTAGEPVVDEVVPADGVEANYVLRQAACVEQNSSHPLSRAVLKAADERGLTLANAQDAFARIGEGVEGCVEGSSIQVGSVDMVVKDAADSKNMAPVYHRIQKEGATPLAVHQDGRLIGIISVSDPIHPDAADMVKALKRLDVGTIGIVSGDHQGSVQRVAAILEATDYWADVKPQGKLDVINGLRNGHRAGPIVFVGDGINDAPSLAAADVGVAMGAKGTEVALETAHVALMHDDISKIPFLIRLGRRTVATIKWNIFFGLAFNLIAVLAGGGGWLSPIMGAVVHNVGSVLVVLSSASISFSGPRTR
jgi:Cd2+/Zn2+-exporting ATPase